jgi:tungstate transport system substrate-binding protein
MRASCPFRWSHVPYLATTTSTQDSGLLDVLIPDFDEKTSYVVKTISVGSGQAMAMGRRGEADVLLVHSPADEEKLIQSGDGINRRLVMHNDFVIVGPPSDPAGVKNTKSSREAFRRIAQADALFLSRGDNSGTHAKEMKLWKAAGVDPEGEQWYQQTGLGMGETLNVASEKSGYTLSDRGTYLALNKQRGLDLEVLEQGDPDLLNVYHVIQVNPEKWPKVNAAGAKAFADFMVSPAAQQTIGRFGVDKYGEPLFTPDAGKTLAELQATPQEAARHRGGGSDQGELRTRLHRERSAAHRHLARGQDRQGWGKRRDAIALVANAFTHQHRTFLLAVARRSGCGRPAAVRPSARPLPRAPRPSCW